MSISLSPEGVEGLFRRLILQGVSPSSRLQQPLMLEDTFGCRTPEASPATHHTLNQCVCVCLAVCFTHTAIEACKYSSQLSPAAPVWQGLQAFRSRLREEALSEYRCCQRRAQ